MKHIAAASAALLVSLLLTGCQSGSTSSSGVVNQYASPRREPPTRESVTIPFDERHDDFMIEVNELKLKVVEELVKVMEQHPDDMASRIAAGQAYFELTYNDLLEKYDLPYEAPPDVVGIARDIYYID